MKGENTSIGKNLNTAYELLSEGFMQGHIFLKTLGDVSNIKLKRNKLKLLKREIEKRNYYEIKAILFSGFIMNQRNIVH